MNGRLSEYLRVLTRHVIRRDYNSSASARSVHDAHIMNTFQILLSDTFVSRAAVDASVAKDEQPIGGNAI